MSDATKFRTMDWTVGLATTIALALSAWSLTKTVNHGERIAVIEDSRYTPEDAADDREKIIAAVGTPRWIEERFDLIKQQNEVTAAQNTSLAQQIEQLARQLDRIQSQIEARR